VAAGVLWALTMATGFGALWRYKMTPGIAAGSAPSRWPDDVLLARTPDRATLVMLAHPKCPCTRASIGELATLMTRLGNDARAYVLFVAPSGVPEGWERSDTWARAG
jgi:hypothetical protein